MSAPAPSFSWTNEFAGVIRVIMLTLITALGGLVWNMSGDVRVINDRMERFGETRQRLENMDSDLRTRIESLEQRFVLRVEGTNDRLRLIETLSAANAQHLADMDTRMDVHRRELDSLNADRIARRAASDPGMRSGPPPLNQR